MDAQEIINKAVEKFGKERVEQEARQVFSIRIAHERRERRRKTDVGRQMREVLK